MREATPIEEAPASAFAPGLRSWVRSMIFLWLAAVTTVAPGPTPPHHTAAATDFERLMAALSPCSPSEGSARIFSAACILGQASPPVLRCLMEQARLCLICGRALQVQEYVQNELISASSRPELVLHEYSLPGPALAGSGVMGREQSGWWHAESSARAAARLLETRLVCEFNPRSPATHMRACYTNAYVPSVWLPQPSLVNFAGLPSIQAADMP